VGSFSTNISPSYNFNPFLFTEKKLIPVLAAIAGRTFLPYAGLSVPIYFLKF
jgi:hypothetical protein